MLLRFPRLRLALVVALLAVFAPPARATDEGVQVVDSSQVDQPPVPLIQTEPTYPMELRLKGIEGQVLVDFLVLPDGTVKSAHAVNNPMPEFGAAAVAAVRQWTFKPALLRGQPVATWIRAPINFALTGARPEPMNLAIGPIQETANIRTGSRGVIIQVAATGSTASQVQAGRFILTQAQDDTGAKLKQEGEPAFHHASVGGVAEHTSREPIAITLWGLAKNARSLRSLEGKLELFLPAADPAATATVDRISSRFGSPLDDPALTKAGVTLIIYDRTTAGKMAATQNPAGPQTYDARVTFVADAPDAELPPAITHAGKGVQKPDSADAGLASFKEKMRKANRMGAHDIGVGWIDPGHRIVALEFQAADGRPLAYNHHGRYHSESESEKKGFDLYDLRAPLPDDARMVCWLLTENSVVPVPLQLADLPLPEPRAAAPVR